MTWPPADPMPGGWSPSNRIVTPDQMTQLKDAAIAAADGLVWADVALINNVASKTALDPTIGRFPIYDPASGFFYSFSSDVGDPPGGYRSRSGGQWYSLTIPTGAGLQVTRESAAVSPAGKFVLGGGTSSDSAQKYRTATNGVDWAIRDSSFDGTGGPGAIVHSDPLGLFITAISASVETSPDGEAWTPRTVPASSDNRAQGVAGVDGSGEPLIIFGGSTATNIITSRDAVAWAHRPLNIGIFGAASFFHSDYYSRFYMWGAQPGTRLYSSSDGVTWSSTGLGLLPGSPGAEAFTVVRGRLFVTAYNSVGVVRYAWSIDGGESWTLADDLASTGGVTGIAISPGGQVCIVNSDGGHFVTRRGGYV